MPQDEMTGFGPGVEMSSTEFAEMRALIHNKTGITIGDNRKSMLESRLRRRLRETDEPNYKSYMKLVRANADETQVLINCVTTNETYFYRTPRVWEYFRQNCVPEFLERETPRAMRVWSGAASTGEEAHTIGILLEDVRLKTKGFDYSVLGTDVSSRVLKIAEEGSYIGKPVSRFQKEEPELFETYMYGDDVAGYKVNQEIKRRIKFKLHNLMEKLSGENLFDVVFLRNVLIYFSPKDQELILENVRLRMRPESVLIIGESETLTRLNTSFEPVAPLIYRAALNTGGA